MRENLFEIVDSARALQFLKDGNQRYVSGKTMRQSDDSRDRTELAEKSQRPFAAVFGCSDSRTAPEILFDVGIGQLFVVRTAGNVADAISIGSMEFAVSNFFVPLILVMGHEKCGAVAGAVSGADFGPNIGAIVREIQPSLEKMRSAGDEGVEQRCENENIRHTVAKLNSSPILSQYVKDKKLLILGAKYGLNTGVVNFDI